MYVYSLPDELEADKQLAPTAAMTDRTAVLTTMPATAERLLKETRIEIDTALDLNRPAAMVMHVQFAKSVELVRPWIDYGLAVAMGTLKNEPEEKGEDDDADGEEDEEEVQQPSPMLFQLGFVVPQLYQFLDVAAAFRSVTSITYEEDGVWVTHSETHIVDLED
jgi:hypothetical protein